MRRDEALDLLWCHREEIIHRFSVKALYLFGSVARDQATNDSDVDALVEFDGLPTFKRFMGLKLYLEDLFDRPVDLVTRKALKSWARTSVEQEAIRAA